MDEKEMQAIPSIPIPSADLITYRFDQADKKFEEMSRKLDAILLQNAQMVSEQKVQEMIDKSLQPTKETLVSYKKYGYAIFSAAALAVFTAIASFLIHR